MIGTTGSDKTTFAYALAQRLAVPHVELDAFWRLLRRTVLRARTRERLLETTKTESFRESFLSRGSILLERYLQDAR